MPWIVFFQLFLSLMDLFAQIIVLILVYDRYYSLLKAIVIESTFLFFAIKSLNLIFYLKF